jgi:hypothetical protein
MQPSSRFIVDDRSGSACSHGAAIDGVRPMPRFRRNHTCIFGFRLLSAEMTKDRAKEVICGYKNRAQNELNEIKRHSCSLQELRLPEMASSNLIRDEVTNASECQPLPLFTTLPATPPVDRTSTVMYCRHNGIILVATRNSQLTWGLQSADAA